MTLLELLVQELPKLGGWPEGAESCVQSAVDGEVYFYNKMYDGSGSMLVHRGEVYLPTADETCLGDDGLLLGCVTHEQYEAALAASNQVEWLPGDLPPEGIECEVKSGKNLWSLCKVVHSSEAGVAFIYLEEPSPEHSSRYIGVLDSIPRKHANKYFRPIRTEAERRREEAVKKMMSCSAVLLEVTAGLIYDSIAAGKIPGIKLAD